MEAPGTLEVLLNDGLGPVVALSSTMDWSADFAPLVDPAVPQGGTRGQSSGGAS